MLNKINNLNVENVENVEKKLFYILNLTTRVFSLIFL